MVKFPERLKSLRKENNMYQKNLAGALGLSRSTITAYESGKREPDQTTLDKIASLFNVSVDYLLGRTENRDLPQLGENTAGINYTPPREWDQVLRETNITSNGILLNSQDKEDIIELVRMAMKTMQKRK